MKSSQKTKIMNLLNDNESNCTSQMYAMFISDPRTRICELKKAGHNLESRACKSHSYHDGLQKEWRLVGNIDGGVVS